jgi:hypothetical protein
MVTPEPEEDAKELKLAMKGVGTDEKSIIKIVSNRTNAHLQKVRSSYKSIYQEDIIEDLKSELSGDLKDTIIALFYEPTEYDCHQLNKAMKGLGTDEDTLIEIIGTRPGWMIKNIRTKYTEMFDQDLVEQVESETSGSFKKLLVSLLQGNRSENNCPNIDKCKQDADDLYKATEGWNTDESVFNKIFVTRSPMELAYIAKYYREYKGNSILKTIEDEFSGDTEKLYKAIVHAVINPSEYFAKRINEAIKGVGTNENLLIRVVVTRGEIDMPLIKQYYKKLFNKDMIEDIKDDTSGDFQDLLVELVSH